MVRNIIITVKDNKKKKRESKLLNVKTWSFQDLCWDLLKTRICMSKNYFSTSFLPAKEITINKSIQIQVSHTILTTTLQHYKITEVYQVLYRLCHRFNKSQLISIQIDHQNFIFILVVTKMKNSNLT